MNGAPARLFPNFALVPVVCPKNWVGIQMHLDHRNVLFVWPPKECVEHVLYDFLPCDSQKLN